MEKAEIIIDIQTDNKSAQGKVDELNKKLGDLKNGASNLGGVMTGMFAGVGIAAISFISGAGEKIKEFISEGIQMAIKQQEQNERMLLSVKGNAEEMKSLISFSKELSSISIFKGSEIRNAEIYAKNLGNSEYETKKMTLAAAALAKITGDDLQTSMQKVASTMEGSIGRLGKLDAGFKQFAGKEGIGAVDLILEKFGEHVSSGMDTIAGRLEKNSQRWDQWKKDVGTSFLGVIGGLLDLKDGFVESFQTIDDILKDKSTTAAISYANKYMAANDAVKKSIRETTISSYQELKKRENDLNEAEKAQMTMYIQMIARFNAIDVQKAASDKLNDEKKALRKQKLIDDEKEWNKKSVSYLQTLKENADNGLEKDEKELLNKILKLKEEGIKQNQKLEDEKLYQITKTNTERINAEDNANKIIYENKQEELKKIEKLDEEFRKKQDKFLDEQIKHDEEQKKKNSEYTLQIRMDVLSEEEKIEQERQERLEKLNRTILNDEALRAKAEIKINQDAENKKQQLRIQTAQQIESLAYGMGNAIQNIQNIELINAGDNEEKKKEIRKKYADINMAMTIAQIIASTAAGVMQAFAQGGTLGFITGGIIAAVGATEVGVAIAQRNEMAKMAKGGLVKGKGTGTSDSIPTMLSNGESVINAEATKRFSGILSSINQSTGGDKIGNNNSSFIDYDLLASKINDKKVYVVSSDITGQQTLDYKIKNRAIIK